MIPSGSQLLWRLQYIRYKRYVWSPKLNILFWNETNTAKKVSSNISYFQEMAQRAIDFSILCKFDPVCSIPRARMAISWKYDMLEDTFLGFSRLIYWYLEICLSLNTILLPGNGPKSSQILNTVQFWPILPDSNCLLSRFLEI